MTPVHEKIRLNSAIGLHQNVERAYDLNTSSDEERSHNAFMSLLNLPTWFSLHLYHFRVPQNRLTWKTEHKLSFSPPRFDYTRNLYTRILKHNAEHHQRQSVNRSIQLMVLWATLAVAFKGCAL